MNAKDERRISKRESVCLSARHKATLYVTLTTQIYLLITHLMKARHEEHCSEVRPKQIVINSCAGDHSKSEPPDPFPNSEVKPLSADGSVGLPM